MPCWWLLISKVSDADFWINKFPKLHGQLSGVHSIERSIQEDTLLVLFNTAVSNLVCAEQVIIFN